MAGVVYGSSPAVLGSSEPQREGILFSRADEDTDGHLTETELRHVFLGFDTNGKPYFTAVFVLFLFLRSLTPIVNHTFPRLLGV